MQEDLQRPDLSGEVRFRVPLIFAIPLGALLFIAVLAIGFSRILLSVPAEAATAIAIVMAVNVLGACAFLALRPRIQRASLIELVLVALYPVVVGIAIAQTGIASEEAGPPPPPPSPAQGGGGGNELVAQDISFNIDTLQLQANQPNEIPFENADTTVHNMSIYEDEDAATAKQDPLFKGPDVDPGSSDTYTIDPIPKGTYTFICDYHANMIGEAVVE
jgi:plastocyanin